MEPKTAAPASAQVSRRRHGMPFGAEVMEEGRVRFRLWAPAARRVELILETSPTKALEMASLPNGWFELIAREACPGSLYRYRIDGGVSVPDPASRRNPDGVHGPSEVVDPLTFEWDDAQWRGRPWNEAVLYELHVGTFSPEGTFGGIEARLDHLEQLGITVIELMPIAAFPGRRGWGYDGILLYAPHPAYGTPDQLKSLIAAAHRRNIAVMLDVVYNHFGPEGNYLGHYSPQFFTDRHRTPWGTAIAFDGVRSRTVRDFFIQNALYWLDEYNIDGLRLDAVHAIRDDGKRHILTDIAAAARSGPGRDRHLHLVLENAANQARYLGPPGANETFDAQWNDDTHHCLHTILTGEGRGIYEDYADHPHPKLCRSLAAGFVYQGEFSQHEGRSRGEHSAHLPPTAFVLFLQNHDQIGNRAQGERLGQIAKDEAALRAAAAIVLLAPSPPLLFMGEEWSAPEPFLYFCDFEPELAEKIREGRKKELARFHASHLSDTLPDPTSPSTMDRSRLDWSRPSESRHAQWLDYYRRLLAIRQRDIVPRIPKIRFGRCIHLAVSGAFAVDWILSGGAVLHLMANLTDAPVPIVGRPAGRMIFATHPNIRAAMARKKLAPWSVTWLLERGHAGS